MDKFDHSFCTNPSCLPLRLPCKLLPSFSANDATRGTNSGSTSKAAIMTVPNVLNLHRMRSASAAPAGNFEYAMSSPRAASSSTVQLRARIRNASEKHAWQHALRHRIDLSTTVGEIDSSPFSRRHVHNTLSSSVQRIRLNLCVALLGPTHMSLPSKVPCHTVRAVPRSLKREKNFSSRSLRTCAPSYSQSDGHMRTSMMCV